MPNGMPQPSFTAGEISPSLYGRVDFDLYYKGLRTCKNFIISKYGGADNRPGTEFAGAAVDSRYPARGISFKFNNDQNYSIVLGHYTMQVIYDGAYLPDANSPPGIMTVATPWDSADLFLLKFTQSADVLTICHPAYPTQQIERLSATNWVVVPFANVNGPFQDINVEKTATVYSSNVLGPVTITASEEIFTSDMVGLPFYMKRTPDTKTYPWSVGLLCSVNGVCIYGDNYYRALNAGNAGTVPPTVTEGTQNDGIVLWEYLHSGFGVVVITGFIDTKHVSATVLTRLPDSVAKASSSIDIIDVVTFSSTNPVRVVTNTPHAFHTGDTVIIENVEGVTDANGTWEVTVINTMTFSINGLYSNQTYTENGSVTNNLSYTATYLWALPAWGSSQGFPGTTAYFQNRQLFGATKGQPSNLWMSRSAGFLDFGQGNPVLDDDAITYKLLSNTVNTIRHIVELTYLILFTSGGIWRVEGGGNGNNVITPANCNLSFQGANPVSDVAPPLKICNYALFIQEKGSEVRSLGYSFAEDAFIGRDVTTMSSHLLQGHTIIDWCYQEIPYSCVWAVRDDGILLGFTFIPEQQVIAWHWHDTQGTVESCWCVTENNQDVVYLIVKRTLNGQAVRCVERMMPRQFEDPVDGFFVDCGLTYDGRDTNTTATSFSGLDHLIGSEVTIVADGVVYPPQVVPETARITIENPAQVVHIGLSYVSELETLDVASLRKDIRDKKKIIPSVSLIVDRSSGFEVGPDVDHLMDYKTRASEDYAAPDTLMSGLIDISVPCTWSKSGRVMVRQSKPLPVSILSVIPQVEVGAW